MRSRFASTAASWQRSALAVVPQFELIIFLLLLGALLAGIARRIRVPYPVLLALLGLALAFAPNLPELALDPSLALALFVAPVLLDAAFDASLRDLRDNWWPVVSLSVIALGLTVVAVAIVVHSLVPDLPWSAAIALGAIVAPPDASAAIAVLRELRPPFRVMVVLEGESLFNDASALLIYRAAVGLTMVSTSFAPQIPWLLFATVISAFVGWILARTFMKITGGIKEVPTAILVQFVTTFLVWILADRLGLSAIITMVVYAITVSRISAVRTAAQLRIPSYAVWEVVVFVLNILVFILVGLQLKPMLGQMDGAQRDFYLQTGAAVCLTAILIRVAWVMSYNTAIRWKNWRFGVHLPRPMTVPTVQSGLVISWCGMRGIVTLATALALPAADKNGPGFPHRDLLLFCAFCVVLGTLIIQGLTLRPLMYFLGMRGDDTVDNELRRARQRATEAALQALSSEQESKAVAVVRREYENRQTTDQPNNAEAERRGSELARVQQHAIEAERKVLADLRHSGEIGDDAFHILEEELDWAEVTARRAAE
jgi:Na+/H+ antiporter